MIAARENNVRLLGSDYFAYLTFKPMSGQYLSSLQHNFGLVRNLNKSLHNQMAN